MVSVKDDERFQLVNAFNVESVERYTSLEK
jgi:hypothetical protein